MQEGGLAADQYVGVILNEIIEGQPGEEKPAGLREDNAALMELDGMWYGIYYCVNTFFLLLFPLTLCTLSAGCLTIEPMTAVIIVVMDKVLETRMTPGLNWYWPIMANKQVVSLQMESLRVMNEEGGAFQVPDATGSPMNVNTMVNYVIDDPVKAQYVVERHEQFINNQAFDVVRRITGRFKYKSNNPMEITLLNHSHIISKYMRKMLQKRCKLAGVEILRMDFIEISYDSSMAQQLL